MLERCAFAKINLDLRILAVRPDGFHELATVFQTISLHDRIRVEAVDQDEPFQLTVDDPDVPSDERNLITRAAIELWSALGRAGTPRGVRISLSKQIPSRAGLGGGSADAAVALGALAVAWSASLSTHSWLDVAARLGSDVPFFLFGGTARGAGRGEILHPWVDAPPFEVVLATPSFGVSTADAFAWYDGDGAPRAAASAPDLEPATSWESWLETCRNDLQAVVVARYPPLQEILDSLYDGGAALALLSGSGSTVFGLFAHAAKADAAAVALERMGHRVHRGQTLPRRRYRSAAFGDDAGAIGLPLD
jgi:4-diphosphocytidyl-2-C-methyl-D-erythritol kinase